MVHTVQPPLYAGRARDVTINQSQVASVFWGRSLGEDGSGKRQLLLVTFSFVCCEAEFSLSLFLLRVWFLMVHVHYMVTQDRPSSGSAATVPGQKHLNHYRTTGRIY